MSASLNAARRADELERLAGGETVDVVVVGGGITGAGVALDAATRGLSVALLERRDLAHGTSRWSSKLVHGGLRYLEHGDVGLAWESARERSRLMGSIAPHLVRPLPFVIPLHSGVARKSGAKAQVGLRVGDALRIGARTSRRVLPPSHRISALEARRLAPALAETGLRAALLSWDGQLEDDARLVVAVARTAAAHGARIITRAGVTGVRDDGVEAVDELTGAAFSVRARRVVIATGVWSGELFEGVSLRPSRGSHLLVPAGRLGDPRAAVNVPVPGERGRWVFALPRADGLVAIGLTDVPADGPVPDVPCPSAEEEALLLRHASAALEVSLGPDDVAGRYAGLRPLLAAPTSPRPTSRAATPCSRTQRRAPWRWSAASSPPTARWPRTPSTVSPTAAAAPRGSRSSAPPARRPAPSPASPAATAPRRPRWPRWAPRTRSPPACRCARRSCAGRSRTSWR